MVRTGVIYVAYGEPAQLAFRTSFFLLRRFYSGPVALVTDSGQDAPFGVAKILFPDMDPGARWAKLHIDVLSPYENTLYLDADTRPYGDISPGFIPLDNGWDIVITPSSQQGKDFLWKCSQEERELTYQVLRNPLPLSLQAGVFWYKKSKKLHDFFENWRSEWKRWSDQDQGALLRTMQQCPMKIWLLGRPWNGGAVIGHNFGSARRK